MEMKWKRMDASDFDAFHQLLQTSFPEAEYRPYEGQKALMKREDYCIVAGYAPNGSLAAALTLYDLGAFLFAEHFAVSPQYRNQGLGSRLLQALRAHTAQRLCLEVEVPESDLARRRIAFYERNGFFLNRYPYVQPSYGAGKPPVPLFLMTTEAPLSEAEFAKLSRRILRQVYGCEEMPRLPH